MQKLQRLQKNFNVLQFSVLLCSFVWVHKGLHALLIAIMLFALFCAHALTLRSRCSAEFPTPDHATGTEVAMHKEVISRKQQLSMCVYWKPWQVWRIRTLFTLHIIHYFGVVMKWVFYLIVMAMVTGTKKLGVIVVVLHCDLHCNLPLTKRQIYDVVSLMAKMCWLKNMDCCVSFWNCQLLFILFSQNVSKNTLYKDIQTRKLAVQLRGADTCIKEDSFTVDLT